ncbi:Rieske (2Fe-2S) protein, partial [Burkholderia pseudomallei]
LLRRGGVAADTGGAGPALIRLWARLRRSPFALLEHVDGHALAKLDASCSRAWPRAPHWRGLTVEWERFRCEGFSFWGP